MRRATRILALCCGCFTACTDARAPIEPPPLEPDFSKAGPITVTIIDPPGDLTVGASIQLSALVTSPAGRPVGARVHWSSSRPDVAGVADDGLLQAFAEGTTRITATVGGFSDSFELTVVGAVTAMPDLTVLDVRAPPSGTVGGTLEIEADVANEGTADAPAAELRFRVLSASDDAELAAVTLAQPGLAAGAGATLTASFGVAAGWPDPVRVEVTTDATGTVEESDEADNTRLSLDIRVESLDLSIESIAPLGSTVVLACTVEIQAVVRNDGNVPSAASTARVTILEAGTANQVASAEVPQPTIDGGASTTVSATFTAARDWPALLDIAVETDPGQLVPEVDETNNAGSAAAAVTTRVTVPSGFHKIWICGSSSSWADADNWEPAGVPTAGQNVYVPAGVSRYPLLTAAVTINDLTIEDGAFVDVGAQELTATGNVVSGEMRGSTGVLSMSRGGKTLRGTVPALVVNAFIGLSGDTRAASVVIPGFTGRRLTLGGFPLTVAGDFSIQSNTPATGVHLSMTSPTDLLDVGGTLAVSGLTQLDAGTVVLRGDFAQTTVAASLTPAGTRFVFDGAGPQTVGFAHPASSFFRDVEVRTPAAVGGVSFTTDVRVAGQLVVAAGAGLSQQAPLVTSYVSRLPEELEAGAYRVETSLISSHVALVKSLSLGWPEADVVARTRGTSLTLQGFALTLAGDFRIESTSGATGIHLFMTNAADRLEVGGKMAVSGLTQLDAGTVVLRGDLAQANIAASLVPTGTRFVFGGSSPQTVSFTHPGSSSFASADILPGSSVHLGSNARMRGDLQLDGTLVVPGAVGAVPARTLTIDGTFFFAGLLSNDGTVTVGACVDEGGTFSGTGNDPCP